MPAGPCRACFSFVSETETRYARRNRSRPSHGRLETELWNIGQAFPGRSRCRAEQSGSFQIVLRMRGNLLRRYRLAADAPVLDLLDGYESHVSNPGVNTLNGIGEFGQQLMLLIGPERAFDKFHVDDWHGLTLFPLGLDGAQYASVYCFIGAPCRRAIPSSDGIRATGHNVLFSRNFNYGRCKGVFSEYKKDN